LQTGTIILLVSSAITLFYFIFGETLIVFVFGESYRVAASLLGWMGLSTIGVSLSSVWLNFYLAQQPRGFVVMLGVAVALEWFLLNLLRPSMQNAVIALGVTGWLLTLGGFLLYIFRARPALLEAHA
jgi:hypothetical protein